MESGDIMNENGDFDVKLNANYYKINEFLKNHPGGTNYIKHYKEKDVAKPMRQYEHSKAAYYLLEEYRKGGRRIEENGDLEGRSSVTRSCNHDEGNRYTFYCQLDNSILFVLAKNYSYVLIYTDHPTFNYQKLVDWDKPMLGQVTNLGSKYYEWVTSPVDRRLRLFGNPVLENLTITPWYVVPLIWIPVIICVTLIGVVKYTRITKDSSSGTIAFYFSVGVFLWTLIEYSLHRWVFHIEPTGKYKLMIYFHFIIHGLHHKVPFDSRRLVFPPFPAAIITFILYQMVSLVFSESTIFLVLAGGITGYVVYDMIHFYLHHGTPAEDTYLYHLKRYHNQHHFAQHESGFGISSMFWDKVFGTALKLRKLNIGIKW